MKLYSFSFRDLKDNLYSFDEFEETSIILSPLIKIPCSVLPQLRWNLWVWYNQLVIVNLIAVHSLTVAVGSIVCCAEGSEWI